MTTQAKRAKHLGLSIYRYRKLVQLSKQLHKWHEDECNGIIQYNEDKQRHYWYVMDAHGSPTRCFGPIMDLESAWLEEARRHATAAGCEVYLQTDPRGCPLYLYKQSDLDAALEGSESLRQPGMGISACYSTVATPIY